ncbi:Lacal_2735 family protein [Aquimarina sp. D1M17]|uniref:Lacal_2735 family protein n=1 Tax=Aquimarina acroporae TaxID=2937283 RepID=UPI0020BFF3D6|nr:Lacal_2735 family protein [Aquimarina acroporae]MCK8521949.1 Lacal_2735 family protein [Aquimarina acroporae]
MFYWLKNKSELQKLRDNYCKLMKKAYLTAIKDKEKSDALHQQAHEILKEIKRIENLSA